MTGPYIEERVERLEQRAVRAERALEEVTGLLGDIVGMLREVSKVLHLGFGEILDGAGADEATGP